MAKYTDYSINECVQCGTGTNNLIFCDNVCWRMHQLFNRHQFRTNQMPQSFSGSKLDWFLNEEEKETAAIYQIEIKS